MSRYSDGLRAGRLMFNSQQVKATPHATGGNNKQGANYRLQKKPNNVLTNIKSRLLQQTQVDDAFCEVKEFYEIKEILIDFIILQYMNYSM
jgi:hypothetical protein